MIETEAEMGPKSRSAELNLMTYVQPLQQLLHSETLEGSDSICDLSILRLYPGHFAAGLRR